LRLFAPGIAVALQRRDRQPSRPECDDVSAPDRDEIQREILAHLAAHPDCEDTLEGIAEWWLLERAIERRLREVEGALDRLVAEGLLERRGGAGARPRYRLRDERRQEVERLVAEREPAGPDEDRPQGAGS
jgi:hypothetical protein